MILVGNSQQSGGSRPRKSYELSWFSQGFVGGSNTGEENTGVHRWFADPGDVYWLEGRLGQQLPSESLISKKTVAVVSNCLMLMSQKRLLGQFAEPLTISDNWWLWYSQDYHRLSHASNDSASASMDSTLPCHATASQASSQQQDRTPSWVVGCHPWICSPLNNGSGDSYTVLYQDGDREIKSLRIWKSSHLERWTSFRKGERSPCLFVMLPIGAFGLRKLFKIARKGGLLWFQGTQHCGLFWEILMIYCNWERTFRFQKYHKSLSVSQWCINNHS